MSKQDFESYREDAIIRPDGTIIYYKYGRYHREGGPAYIHPNGTQYWFIYRVIISLSCPDWVNCFANSRLSVQKFPPLFPEYSPL